MGSPRRQPPQPFRLQPLPGGSRKSGILPKPPGAKFKKGGVWGGGVILLGYCPPHNPRFIAWPLELGLGTHNPRFIAWPLELGLGTHNPRFIAWPLELGLGTHKPRFIAWPLELGLGTHNPRFVAWPLELGLGTRNPRFGCRWSLAHSSGHPICLCENRKGAKLSSVACRAIRLCGAYQRAARGSNKIVFLLWSGHCFGKDAQSCGSALEEGRGGNRPKDAR